MNKMAVFFPGIGYHCDKPLLYYAQKLAAEKGYEKCIRLSYSTDIKGNLRGNADRMQKVFQELYMQAEQKLSEINFQNYDKVLFISKSVGTIIASAYAKQHGIVCRHVLYTPLDQTFVFEPQNAIAFIGTKDQWSKADKIVALSKDRGIPVNVYEDANHSLESGSVHEDIVNLEDIMERTRTFLKD